jgi:hypothetical protein
MGGITVSQVLLIGVIAVIVLARRGLRGFTEQRKNVERHVG